MKHTGTPAWKLTADCIWNSFRSSGKQHLIITGGRQRGKSTTLRALFPAPLPGITTHALPMTAVTLTDNLSGETVQVGVFDPALPGKENRMRPLAAGFDTAGVRMLSRCVEAESEWIVIDEIGYLETSCARYLSALLALMERKRVAAVLRKQDLPFLHALCTRKDVFLVDLDQPFRQIGCVIMASGMGRRFGGNKLTADFCGQPMIRHILSATDGIFARRVVVTRHEDVRRLCLDWGADVLMHELPLRSDTVRLGLEAIGTDVQHCMFCPADQPLLSRSAVASLALCCADEKEFIWRAAHNGRPASPVSFPQSCFDSLLHLPDGRGGSAVISSRKDLVRLLNVDDPRELMDADTPEALNALANRK